MLSAYFDPALAHFYMNIKVFGGGGVVFPTRLNFAGQYVPLAIYQYDT